MAEETDGTIGIEVEASEIAPDSEQDAFAAEMWERPEVDGDEEISVTPTTTDGNPEEAEVFKPSETNLSRHNPEDVPEGVAREVFTAGQRQFKGLQTTLNERDQEILQLRTQLGNGTAQQQQQQQPPQQQQTEPTDPLNPYPYLPIPETYTAQEREEIIRGAHQVNSIIDHRLQTVQQYLDTMPQLYNAVIELVNRSQGDENQLNVTSKEELANIHGENAPLESAVLALAMRDDVLNPATDEPFTYVEAYERVHGITAEQVKVLEAKRLAAKSAAKRSGAPAPRANTETPASTGKMDNAQVVQTMAAAGWNK